MQINHERSGNTGRILDLADQESNKNAIREANDNEIKESVEKTRKVNYRWQKGSKVRDYLSYMNLINARQ